MTEIMTTEQKKALEVIDEYIFHNIFNAESHHDGWEVTWSGYRFLAVNLDTGKAYAFEVDYKPLKGFDWSELLADQELEGIEVVE